MPRRKLDGRERKFRAAVRAFVKLDAELERILNRAAEIAETVPLYTVREKVIVYAIATEMNPSASENEIDRALRRKGIGVGRPTLRATLADLQARGIVTSARVSQRGGTHARWSLGPGKVSDVGLYPLRRGSVKKP
jgi:DNA-binding transcriptional ArsR family regulator